MALKKGDIIATSDVPTAVKAKVTAYIQPYSSVRYTGGSSAAIMNAIDSVKNTYVAGAAADKNKLKEEYRNNPELSAEVNAEKIGAKAGNIIFIDPVLRMIYDGIRQGCRTGTVTWSEYPNIGYTNTNSKPSPRSYSQSTLFPNIHPSVASYEKYVDAVKASNSRHIKTDAAEFKGQIIEVLDLTNLMDLCISINARYQQSHNQGCINSCYFSCHQNCHGSSRSRR